MILGKYWYVVFSREYTEREVELPLFTRKARICKHQFELTEHECNLVFGRALNRSMIKCCLT